MHPKGAILTLTLSNDSVIICLVTTPVWTLDELGDRVERALSVDYVAAGSARVRAVPDARTIRYYTTLGLVDRPSFLPHRGRTAHYGERHLRQLVAIKRLQADGLTLVQIQERLAGLPDGELAKLARVPSAALEAAPAQEPAPPPAPARASFWRDVPSAVVSDDVDSPTPETVSPPEARRSSTGRGLLAALDPLVGVPLAPGAALLVAAPRPILHDDLEELRRAAAPLLEALRARGLLARATSNDDTQEGELA